MNAVDAATMADCSGVVLVVTDAVIATATRDAVMDGTWKATWDGIVYAIHIPTDAAIRDAMKDLS